MKAILITTYLLNILLNAIGDGFWQKGKKLIGHSLVALGIGTLLVLPLLTDLSHLAIYQKILILIGYILMRLGLFDPVRNLFRGDNVCYVGNTSYEDFVWGWFNPPCAPMMFGRVILLLLGVFTIVNL